VVRLAVLRGGTIMTRYGLVGVLTGALLAAGPVSGAAQKKAEKAAEPEKKLEKQITLNREGGTVAEFLSEVAQDCAVTILLVQDEVDKAGMKGFADRKAGKVAVKDVPADRVLADVLQPLGAEGKPRKGHIEIVPAKKDGGP
jgi:hypothetical protein